MPHGRIVSSFPRRDSNDASAGRQVGTLAFVFLVAWAVTGCASKTHPASRVILPSCLAPAHVMFAADTGSWVEQAVRISGLHPDQVVIVELDSFSSETLAITPWITDQCLLGWENGNPVALEFPGERGLAGSGATLLRRMMIRRRPVGKLRPYPASRYDAGGNVLVVPSPTDPMKPYAIVTSRQIQPDIKSLMRAAVPSRRLIELDTDWLKVGHVDEIVAFVPGKPGQSAIRVVIPDPEAGLALLRSVPPDYVLFTRGPATFGTLAGSDARWIQLRRPMGKVVNSRAVVRILSGPQAGLIGRVLRIVDGRIFIDQCWDLRGGTPSLAVQRIREGHCETMPIWFDSPEPGA